MYRNDWKRNNSRNLFYFLPMTRWLRSRNRLVMPTVTLKWLPKLLGTLLYRRHDSQNVTKLPLKHSCTSGINSFCGPSRNANGVLKWVPQRYFRAVMRFASFVAAVNPTFRQTKIRGVTHAEPSIFTMLRLKTEF